MHKILKSLNAEQREAVKSTEGYVRVLAGPGTGKTRVLVARLAYLIKKCEVPSRKILSITFTNKAASEIQKRIADQVGEYTRTDIYTFHGFCNNFLRRHITKLRYPKNFQIMDKEDQLALVRRITGTMNLNLPESSLGDVLDIIKRHKKSRNYIAALAKYFPHYNQGLQLPPSDDNGTRIFYEYLRQQRDSNFLDFDDLLHFTLYVLDNFPDILNFTQSLYRHIQVDEFQDVNHTQFHLLERLQGKNKNLFVVGDPDQAIYSWRGSNPNFITFFATTFHPLKTVMLTTNYRSTSCILSASNELIKNNSNRFAKELIGINHKSDGIEYCECKDIDAEAAFIASKISDLRRNENLEFKDIAVLYRNNRTSRIIEHALLENEIPYIIVKGTEFYNRQEVKDLMAFMRLLVFEDDLSFLRIINKPARGMGKKRIEYLRDKARAKNMSLWNSFISCRTEPLFHSKEIRGFIKLFKDIQSQLGDLTPSEVLIRVFKGVSYEKFLSPNEVGRRLKNIRQLYAVMKRYEEANHNARLGDFLTHIVLNPEQHENTESNMVKLMTVHSAKGLEFPHVIIAGMNQHVFPSFSGKLEEERRLFYVALTRAKSGVTLTCARGKNYNGIPLTPSRFINELPAEQIRRIRPYRNYYWPSRY